MMINKKCLKSLTIGVLVSVCLINKICYSAIITDNDENAFVTKSEFEEIKSNIMGQLEAYNNNLDNAIDAAIAEYLVGINGGAISEDFYDSIYPIGIVVVSPKHPDVGEWVEVTGDKPRALWLQNGSWGSTLAERIPKPKWVISEATPANHTFTGNTITSENGGNHTHSLTQSNKTANGEGTYTKTVYWNGEYTLVNFPTVSGKAHWYTPVGTVGEKAHTHTLPAITTAIYLRGSTVMQPDLYYIKMWQRVS